MKTPNPSLKLWRRASGTMIGGGSIHHKFALIEGIARKGNVPPPHIHHREDETFYVLEGEMTVSVGNPAVKINGTPGSVIFAPRGVMHSFDINSKGSSDVTSDLLPLFEISKVLLTV